MNSTARKQIRRLLDQYDRLAAGYADALIRGQGRRAHSRQSRLGALARRIAHLAHTRPLRAWVRTQLAKN